MNAIREEFNGSNGKHSPFLADNCCEIKEENVTTDTDSTCRENNTSCKLFQHLKENCDNATFHPATGSDSDSERINQKIVDSERCRITKHDKIPLNKSDENISKCVDSENSRDGSDQTEERSFTCTKCEFRSNNNAEFEIHLLSHNALNSFTCSICDYVCFSKLGIKAHMSIHINKSFSCSKCEYTAAEIVEVENHMVTHTKSEKIISCKKCNIPCFSKGVLRKHMKSHSSANNLKKLYRCKKCNFDCNSYSTLKSHRHTHSTEAFKCTECNYHCRSELLLLKHNNKLHSGIKSFKCTLCDYASIRKSSLAFHMYVHTGEKPYQCKECSAKFTQKSSLNQHMLSHNGEKPHSCNICEYRSLRKHELTEHIRTHTGEKPFQCTDCEYKSSRKGELKKHMRQHTGEKPFLCPKCGVAFAYLSNFKNHILTHTGEKPFKCNSCLKQYSKMDHLKQHMLSHTGEKSFSCSECDFKCSRKSILTRHMIKHTGEKPYACQTCDAKFSQNGNLKQHMLTHTGEKPFVCPYCDYKCIQGTNLKQHIRNHHQQFSVDETFDPSGPLQLINKGASKPSSRVLGEGPEINSLELSLLLNSNNELQRTASSNSIKDIERLQNIEFSQINPDPSSILTKPKQTLYDRVELLTASSQQNGIKLSNKHGDTTVNNVKHSAFSNKTDNSVMQTNFQINQSIADRTTTESFSNLGLQKYNTHGLPLPSNILGQTTDKPVSQHINQCYSGDTQYNFDARRHNCSGFTFPHSVFKGAY